MHLYLPVINLLILTSKFKFCLLCKSGCMAFSFSLSAGLMISFINREYWENIAGSKGFAFYSHERSWRAFTGYTPSPASGSCSAWSFSIPDSCSTQKLTVFIYQQFPTQTLLEWFYNRVPPMRYLPVKTFLKYLREWIVT